MKTNAFVRQLASNKRTVRENALSTLKRFLSSKEKAVKLDTSELNKLWKGLFYTMWFCDRPRPQQRLANELAKLFSESIVEEQFCKFVESFWTVMCKEWRELDKWRVDKFLMLMRYIVRECLVRLKESEWDADKIGAYFNVLENVILKDDDKTPRSITYHIIDVWVDELERVIFSEEEDNEEDEEEEEEEELTKEERKEKHDKKIAERKAILEEQKVPMDLLLAPFKALCGSKNFPPLVKKIQIEILSDKRLTELDIDTKVPKKDKNSEEEDDEEEEEEEEWKGFGN